MIPWAFYKEMEDGSRKLFFFPADGNTATLLTYEEGGSSSGGDAPFFLTSSVYLTPGVSSSGRLGVHLGIIKSVVSRAKMLADATKRTVVLYAGGDMNRTPAEFVACFFFLSFSLKLFFFQIFFKKKSFTLFPSHNLSTSPCTPTPYPKTEETL